MGAQQGGADRLHGAEPSSAENDGVDTGRFPVEELK